MPTIKIASFSGKYRFLSNFFPAVVEYEGIVYPSTEHAYQAAKTLDIEVRKEIAALPTAGKAKRAGYKVQLRDDWESVKIDVMHTLLESKFNIPELRDKLLATENAHLEEGNTWGDTFWGTVDGKGRNELGKLLMLVREELRQ